MLFDIDKSGISFDTENSPVKGSRDMQMAMGQESATIIYGYLFFTDRNAWLQAEAFSESWEQHPERLFKDTDGSGTVLHFNKRTRSLQIWTDPYRLYCLYVYRSKGHIYLSESLTEIQTKFECTVNKQAVLELAAINCTIGSKTLLQDVETLDEGCVYTFKVADQVLENQKAVCPFPQPDGSRVSIKDFQEHFYAHVQKGMAMSGQVSLALTSGLDSRATLAACLPWKEQLHTYVHGLEGSMDVRIAGQIAQKNQLNHQFYNLNDQAAFIDRIPEYTDRVNAIYEGSLSALSHAHAHLSYSKQSALTDTFFSSFGGELLRSYYLPKQVDKMKSLEEMADGIRSLSQVKADLSVFQTSESQCIDDLNHAIYLELVQAPVTDDLTYVADYYYHRRNFNSVTTRYVGKYFRVFNPYFSREIYRMVPNIPAAWKQNAQLQKQLVVPAGAKLTSTLLNEVDSIHDTWFDKAHIAYSRLHYYGKVLANKWSNKWTYRLYFTDYDAWLKSNHQEWLCTNLEARAEKAGLHPEATRTLFESYLSGTVSFSYYKYVMNLFSTMHFLDTLDYQQPV